MKCCICCYEEEIDVWIDEIRAKLRNDLLNGPIIIK